MTTPPIKISDEMIEVGARRIAEEHGSTVFDDDREPYEYTEVERSSYRAEAQAFAEAVAPLIAAQVLREAADGLSGLLEHWSAAWLRDRAGRLLPWVDPDEPENGRARAHGQAIGQRDNAEHWADLLAGAIADHFGEPIGEHSNDNNPWWEALKIIQTPGVSGGTQK